MSNRDENAFITCVGHVSASGDNDLTIEFISEDGSKRALIGIDYETGHWYSLVGLNPPVAIGPIRITDWREAVEIVEDHMESK